jgi:hypothetical protein
MFLTLPGFGVYCLCVFLERSKSKITAVKNCQFCSESLKEAANYCTHCNHDQKDPSLLWERLIRIQALRFLPVAIGLSAPLATLAIFLGEWRSGIELFKGMGEIIVASLFCFLFLPILFPSIPAHFFKDSKIPHLIQRIEHCKKAMVLNWMVLPLVGVSLVFLQFKLANNKPSENDFQKYLKTTSRFTEKDNVQKIDFVFGTYNMVYKGDDMLICIGMNKQFIPLNPNVFYNFSNSLN